MQRLLPRVFEVTRAHDFWHDRAGERDGGHMRVDWAAQVLTEANLTVVEEDGWTTRGKEFSSGPLGVILHHDASKAGSVPEHPTVIIDGRSDLPGPLAQFYLDRNGVWHVVASGKANHAGSGYYNGIHAGNSSLLGVEAANNGTDEPWPEGQLRSYVVGVAAILCKLGAPSLMAIGHKEWAPTRKIDPSFDMDVFRAFVKIVMLELCPEFPGVILRRNASSRGVATRWVRRQLARLGGDVTPGDVFDVETEKAVRKFRRQKGMKEEGIVDQATWAALGAPWAWGLAA